MLLRRIYDQRLAQASYLVGCQVTGEALVVDPNRLVGQYAAAADADHLRVTHVAETHVHADFVSGARQLARDCQAQLFLSGEGGPDWAYRFAAPDAADGVRLLRDEDSFTVGSIRIDVVHTPGHSPEHVVFLLTDTTQSSQPTAMLSGDFILAGDVGRPDLLERSANAIGTMDGMARELFRSLQRFRDYPATLRIWPGHGAGSACGKAIGTAPSTTLGQERLANWAFQIASEGEFVCVALADQPEPPRYFARMKELNRAGSPLPDIAKSAALPPVITLADLEARQQDGGCIIDLRSPGQFAAGHIPGIINIPSGVSLARWVGSLIPYERDLVLLSEDCAGSQPTSVPSQATSAIEALALIGFDRVVGIADTSVLHAWVDSGRPLQATQRIDPLTLSQRHDLRVVDVRSATEWSAGNIPGATHAYLGDLLELVAPLPLDSPLVAHCQSGERSSIAASLLRAHGFASVATLAGGIDAWKAAGLPLIHEP